MKGERRSMHPSDVRLANALKIVAELRESKGSTNSDVARSIRLSVPGVHRLMSELVKEGLVQELDSNDTPTVGRPATTYRFREEAATLVGVDIGNGTTRIILTQLDGHELASLSFRTDELGLKLPSVLAKLIQQLCRQHGDLPLVGVGIGVPAAVDPTSGVLHHLPILREYEGLFLAHEVGEFLDCPIAVQQDDHFSALAESSSRGSRPGVRSLLVLEIGWGIGVGACVNGQPVAGHRGSFGRIARWPVSVDNDCLPGTTLGEVLTTDGLLKQYQKRGGHFPIKDGLGLVEVARGCEQEALEVLSWAGQEIAETILRLTSLCDPEGVVFGGGMSQAFDLFKDTFVSLLPEQFVPVPSLLKDRAVVVGAVLEANRFVEGWLRGRLSRT